MLSVRNVSSLTSLTAVDLDADGQVDLLALSWEREGGGGGEGQGTDCYTLGVYWMGTQGEGLQPGEECLPINCSTKRPACGTAVKHCMFVPLL